MTGPAPEFVMLTRTTWVEVSTFSATRGTRHCTSSPNNAPEGQEPTGPAIVWVSLFQMSNRTSYAAPLPAWKMSRRVSQSPAGIVAPDVGSTYQQAVSPTLSEMFATGPGPCVVSATLLYVHAVSVP